MGVGKLVGGRRGRVGLNIISYIVYIYIYISYMYENRKNIPTI
jgi:hypothetical protein